MVGVLGGLSNHMGKALYPPAEIFIDFWGGLFRILL